MKLKVAYLQANQLFKYKEEKLDFVEKFEVIDNRYYCYKIEKSHDGKTRGVRTADGLQTEEKFVKINGGKGIISYKFLIFDIEGHVLYYNICSEHLKIILEKNYYIQMAQLRLSVDIQELSKISQITVRKKSSKQQTLFGDIGSDDKLSKAIQTVTETPPRQKDITFVFEKKGAIFSRENLEIFVKEMENSPFDELTIQGYNNHGQSITIGEKFQMAIEILEGQNDVSVIDKLTFQQIIELVQEG